MNICQSNTHKKDWNWLHFDDESTVQERQQVKDQPIFVTHFLVAVWSTSPNIAAVFHARLHDRFVGIKSNIREKKPHRTNQGSNFLGGSFSYRDNTKTSIQFRRKRQPQHLKRLFFCKNKPILFHITNTSVIIPIKQHKLIIL